MIVYRCEDTLESIFTAIYRAYEEKRDHADTMICLDREYYLFAEDIEVTAEPEKAEKVIRTLRKRFGRNDYQAICYALSAPSLDKAQAVYQVIVKGLKESPVKGHLLDQLADPNCYRVFTLLRAALREDQHLKGFLRFQEMEGGVLWAEVGPKNNLMTFLMPHFADRFPLENFLICDCRRGIWGIHPAGGEWYLMNGQEIGKMAELPISEEEEQIHALFRQFCQSIAIKERENLKLQRNLLPLRFREYMSEFAKS